ncbi:MAG: NAD+ synthase [Proteobacteria bacterium]|nr:MAG: NAD+ synthase [Pseudomonadota bacterium]
MKQNLSIGLAQINLVVGDIPGNIRRVVEAAERARDEFGVDILVCPELTITGYPPEDLLLRTDFVAAAEAGVAEVRDRVGGIVLAIGHPEARQGRLYNAASVISDGKTLATYYKRALPNYGVFDEKRYFDAGSLAIVFPLNGWRLGITICEDVWESAPVVDAVGEGAEIILNLNASPFHINKSVERETLIVGSVARRLGVPVVYTNLVGGQDELVFDGASFVVDGDGHVVHRMPAFEQDLSHVVFGADEAGAPCIEHATVVSPAGPEETVYRALVTGVRDYVRKNGFPGVVIGLSGGVDSALTLAIAVDALGAADVIGVSMPSRYTREMSIEDAFDQCQRQGVACHRIDIDPMFQSFLDPLQPIFEGLPVDATEENIQARTRGILLMAISNKTGKMVLTTGNKSELAVGYATLYGDMVGGFAAIKDVPKTWVYRLAKYRNTQSEVIPERVITRPPSAELAPDQLDSDSLPAYEVLDPIIEAYVENDLSPAQIIELGHDADEVHRVLRMINRNEYKRRQAPPGVRISKRAFGRDRRYPLTSGFQFDPRNAGKPSKT